LIAWVTVDPSTVKANLVATELEASSLPVFFGRKIAGTALGHASANGGVVQVKFNQERLMLEAANQARWKHSAEGGS